MKSRDRSSVTWRCSCILGATWTNVVKVTTFLTRREDIEGYRAARQRHIPNDPPASTLLFISGLAHPDYLIEVEATAVLD